MKTTLVTVSHEDLSQSFVYRVMGEINQMLGRGSGYGTEERMFTMMDRWTPHTDCLFFYLYLYS